MNGPLREDPRQPGAGDARWLDTARQALDEGADALDAATLSRLNRARQAALDAARARRAPRWLPAALAAGACAALAIAAALPLLRGGAEVAPPVAEAGADFEMLAGAEDLALYEDLEFYAWLDSQQPSEG